MSDVVLAAIVGVGGAVIVAIAGAITQAAITRYVIRADREKLQVQLLGEATLRQREKRHDRLLDAIAELLQATDPQVAPGGDYDRAVPLIGRIQLQLDQSDPAEKALNGALNELGFKLQDYIGVRHLAIDHKSLETRALLGAQGAVTDLASKVLKQHAT